MIFKVTKHCKAVVCASPNYSWELYWPDDCIQCDSYYALGDDYALFREDCIIILPKRCIEVVSRNKLWILRLLDEEWQLDRAEGFVIRADTEQKARELAVTQAGREGTAWLLPELASCEPLMWEGREGIILKDFKAG